MAVHRVVGLAVLLAFGCGSEGGDTGTGTESGSEIGAGTESAGEGTGEAGATEASGESSSEEGASGELGGEEGGESAGEGTSEEGAGEGMGEEGGEGTGEGGGEGGSEDGSICCATYDDQDRLLCTLGLVRTDETVPDPVGMQFRINWPAERASLIQFQDELCVAEGCFTVEVPPQSLHPSGHSVTINPKEPSEWEGTGVVILLHFSPAAPGISEAWYREDGTIEGDPAFVELVFDAHDAIDASDPLCFTFEDLVATEVSSFSMPVWVEDDLFVVGQ